MRNLLHFLAKSSRERLIFFFLFLIYSFVSLVTERFLRKKYNEIFCTFFYIQIEIWFDPIIS